MADDFSALKAMRYSGRSIVIGETPSGISFVGYGLTGRSSSSQARELKYDEKSGVVRTVVTNKEELEKGSPALLIYPAIACVERKAIVVSNGAQTRIMYSAARDILESRTHDLLSLDIMGAFDTPEYEYDPKNRQWIDITTFEPDGPNFTPRINGAVTPDDAALMSIACVEGGRYIKNRDLSRIRSGEARMISTYEGGNENPLKPFLGECLEARIASERSWDIAEALYDSIKGGEKEGDNFRVAAAVMMMTPSGLEVAVINRSERGN